MDAPEEVVETLAEAFVTVYHELEALDVTPVMVPVTLDRWKAERNTACAVLRRVLRAAPPERRRRLGQMIREEWENHQNDVIMEHELGTYPVMKEALYEARRAIDDLTRRERSDPEARDALEPIRRL